MKNQKRESTIRGLQVKLTPSQYEEIAGGSKGRELSVGDFAACLPTSKYQAILPYLKDPDYHVCVTGPVKGEPPSISIRLNRVDEIVFLPKKTARIIEKIVREKGITPNQFINLAIREKIAGLEAK